MSSTDLDGNTTSYGYSPPWGDLASITTPQGHEALFTYNASHQLTSLTRVTNTVAQTGPTTDFSYYAFGTATSLGCTADEKATVVTDPDGVAGAAGHTTTYCANADDEVLATINADGQQTAAVFNPFGNTEASTAAARGTGDSQGIESFVYDASGQDVNCIVAGTATQQTTCPTGPLPSGYATNLGPAGEPPSHDPIACFRASLES